MNEAGQTICLCMIVKNERHVISRCLQSVLPLLDAWLIVDTGSTDGTQQCVQEFLSHLPGELIERPWVNFAQNRSDALRHARGRADYVLIIDADEVLELSPGFNLPELTADAYDFEMLSGQLAYYKTQLVSNALEWRYLGVVHEHIVAVLDTEPTRERLSGVRELRIPDGARSRDPMTYRRDAFLLEEALLQEPNNARHLFYLAQSYADAREPDLAIDRYTKRVAMGGWPEEVWTSLYQIARLKEMKGADWPQTLTAYLAAFSYRPDRAEPLYRIGMYYQAQKQYSLAYLFFAQAMHILYPVSDLLFVEKEVYDYLLPLEFAVACFYVGHHDEAITTANQLLATKNLSADQVEQVKRNRQFSLDALS
jgi:glycosyltransferase involved in cell wall biosynthesis